MASIKSALFNIINLHATQNNTLRVEQTGFRGIGPFIRQINFFPSPYFPDISISKFKDMLDLHYTLIRVKPNICAGCARADSDDIDIKHDDWYPLSQEEISMRYQSYMERALKDQHSAIDGSLPKVWTKMLRFSKQVNTIKLCPVSKAISQMPYRINEVAARECEWCEYNDGFMDDLSGGSGDCLLAAVVESLASTALPIQSLSTDCELKHAPTADWRALHWKKLRHNRIEDVTISGLPYGLRAHKIEPDPDRKAQILFTEVLWEVRRTVQRITLRRDRDDWSGDRSDSWPSTRHLDSEFPSLRSLDVYGIVLPPSVFTPFIATCTALEMLKLEVCEMEGEDGEWKAFFDMVRKRPRALQLTCIQYRTCLSGGILFLDREMEPVAQNGRRNCKRASSFICRVVEAGIPSSRRTSRKPEITRGDYAP